MSPEMRLALQRISLLHAIEPETVFQAITAEVAGIYGAPDAATMAMINLVDGPCLAVRTVMNRHRLFRRANSLDLESTLCQTALQSSAPLLVQNAAEHVSFRNHVVVRLKLRRYLGVPVCRPDGATIGTLCFLDDRTDAILGEDDIQFLSLLAMRVGAELERERMIEERVASHRNQARLLEEKALEKRRFLSMIIHDLRHPLAAIRPTLHLLRTEPDVRIRSEYLDAVENRARALASLLDELIEYDRIDSGKPNLKIEEVDLTRLINGCLADTGAICTEQQLAVSCILSDDLGTARTDAGKVRHILANLVANALKFTPSGTITVSACRLNEERWRLRVEDTGIGMSQDQARAVAESCDKDPLSGGAGTGLGLEITRRLAQALEAQVSCVTTPGIGTTFTVDFPLRVAQQSGEVYAD